MVAKRLIFSVLLVTLVVCAGGLGALFFAVRGFAPQPANPLAADPAPITQLTHDPGNAVRPAWSPDNQMIAYESNRDGLFQIYLMSADGNQQRALTAGSGDNRHPTWTPDGKSIVYDSFDGTHQDIWTVDVANGNKKQLTHVNGMADYASASPDGKLIAFYLYCDFKLNIWTARADGSDAKPLTLDLGNAWREEPTTAWHEPSWSPDSQWLAYAGGDGRSIWMIRSDGTDAHPVIVDEEDNHFPWFLADGRLAFITEYVPPRYEKAWTTAWAYDLKTGARSLLQDRMCMQGPVDWTKDNSKIAFHSPRAGRFDIYLIDLTTPEGIRALRGTTVPAEPDENE